MVNTGTSSRFSRSPNCERSWLPRLECLRLAGSLRPGKLPKEIVDKWDKALEEACKDPAFLEQAGKIYKVVAYLGPKEFWEFMQEEYKRYLPLAIKMGIRK